MALSESGGVQVAPIAYGSAGHRKAIKPRKGPAKGSISVRGGRKQSLYVKPRGRK